MMSLLKKASGILLVVLLSFFSIQPLFSPGFYPVHDDTQVERVYEMKSALADGMFPVRWVPDLGYNYGYPIFNFYGPLAYYVGGFFNLIGFDSLVATKIMIGLGMVLAGVFMYLLAREFWGRIGGIISALLYVYAPYHALNIYVRGAIGELWAYAMVPLAFFGLYSIFKSLHEQSNQVPLNSKIKNQKSKKQIKIQKLWIAVLIAAIGFAGVVVSHNLTTMMVTPFLFGFLVLLYSISRFRHNERKSYFILLSFFIGILLSAFYWFPVFTEMKYTNVLSVVGGGSDYKDHFVCLRQLWDSQWGFAGSTVTCVDGMSFKIGKLHILFALLALVPLFFLRKQKKQFYAITLGLLLSIISAFLTLEYSKFIWDAIPHMAFFQFPWRFLVLISFAISFVGGSVLLLVQKSKPLAIIAGCVAAVVIIYFNLEMFAPSKFNNKTAEEYTNKSHLVWETSKISDEYMPPKFQIPKNKNQVPERKILEQKGITISEYNEKTQRISAKISAQEKKEILVNIAYFPGWHVFIDGKQVEFKYFQKGLLVVVPQGEHTVELVFSQTSIEQIANAISLTGVFVLIAGIIYSRNRRV